MSNGIFYEDRQNILGADLMSDYLNNLRLMVIRLIL